MVEERDRRGSAQREAGRQARPLDAAKLDELALAYVARFATSSGKLAVYLRRKLRERGWEGEASPDVAALVGRMVERGYVDDALYARAQGQGLQRRGYGARRIADALDAAGIESSLIAPVLGGEAEQRAAALAFARRRRLGPFGREGASDPALRSREVAAKQIAALLRAGHPLAMARALVDAASIEQAEEWSHEAIDE